MAGSPCLDAPAPAPRVLLIAYHFPPVGGPGAQRSLNIVRELTRQGVDVAVITGGGTSADFWVPSDPGGVGELDDRIEVIRIERPQPAPPGRTRRGAERYLGMPTAFESWFCDGVLDALPRLALRPDVILGLLVPYETCVAVMAASEAVGVPWVADLLDPWAFDEMWLYPSVAQRLLDQRKMRAALRDAAAVIMNTQEAARRVATAFPEIGPAVVAIPSGFAPGDFAAPEPNRRDGIFDIVHTGSMHTEFGLRHRRRRRMRRALGGMPVPSADYLTRSHIFLLEAIDALLGTHPDIRARLRLRLSGAMTDVDRAFAVKADYAETLGFLSHDATIELIRSADLLFLPMHDVDGRAGLVPTKTYEYLGSGRPILAAVPDGDARELLAVAGTATIVRPADVAGMESAVLSAFRRWEQGIPDPSPRSDVVTRYDYGRLVRQIADVLRRAACVR